MLRASFRFVISEALLAEYRQVLLRPKLWRLHRLVAAEVDQILTDLALHAIVLPGAPPTAKNAWRQTLATSFYGSCWPVVNLSTAAGSKSSNMSWLNIGSARWLKIELALTLAFTTQSGCTQNWATCLPTLSSVNRHLKNLSNCPKVLDHYICPVDCSVCAKIRLVENLSVAAVAQWIEYWPPKPRVVGSIPASRTRHLDRRRTKQSSNAGLSLLRIV